MRVKSTGLIGVQPVKAAVVRPRQQPVAFSESDFQLLRAAMVKMLREPTPTTLATSMPAFRLAPGGAAVTQARSLVTAVRARLERAVSDGWVDSASATQVRSALKTNAEEGAKLLASLEVGVPGHVDAQRVQVTLNSAIDELGLREEQVLPLRLALRALSLGDGSSAAWVTDARELRRAIAEAGRVREP